MGRRSPWGRRGEAYLPELEPTPMAEKYTEKEDGS